jgi:cell division protein FtsZ
MKPVRLPIPGESTQFASHEPVLKVLGLGGGGGNAVNRMIELGLKGAQFIAANTDAQALQTCLAPVKIQLGPKLTRGLGAGGNPQIGRAAAEESRRELERALSGADMIFLTAGMGGGTGTGAIPIAAQTARATGAVTIAIVTTPFAFEQGRRQRNATEGLRLLRQHTHTLITIPNERLLYLPQQDLPLEVSFRLADDVLRQAVEGITTLITAPGLINVDFAHIRRLMQLGGGALMSIGYGEGKDKAQHAIHQALHHQMLDKIPLENASGVITNFTGAEDLSLLEVSRAMQQFYEQLGDRAEIVMGVTTDKNMRGRVQVILVITGLGAPTLEEAMAATPAIHPLEAHSEREPALIEPLLTTASEERFSLPLLSNVEHVSDSVDTSPIETAIANNLDLPAFLRRRLRYADREP